MEVCALEREAGPDAAPQLGDIDLDEQPAAAVADALPSDHNRCLQHCLFETQLAERPGRVPRQIDSHACLAPGGLPLDDLGREAGTGERPSGRQTRDAGPDDEDA